MGDLIMIKKYIRGNEERGAEVEYYEQIDLTNKTNRVL